MIRCLEVVSGRVEDGQVKLCRWLGEVVPVDQGAGRSLLPDGQKKRGCFHCCAVKQIASVEAGAGEVSGRV